MIGAWLQAEAKGRMQSLLQALPHPYRVCSISADRKQWWQTSGEQDMLVVSVCHVDRQPLLIGLAASNTPQVTILTPILHVPYSSLLKSIHLSSDQDLWPLKLLLIL